MRKRRIQRSQKCLTGLIESIFQNTQSIFSDIKRAERRAKLAALTAHLRNCEDADKGKEPTNNSVMEPVTTATHVSQTRLPVAENIPAPKTPSKNSKWAQLAAERAIWDNDELQQTPSKAPKPDISSVQMTSNLPVFPNLQTLEVAKASSARDQVQAALQKAGKKTTTIFPKAKHQKAKFFEDRIDSLVAQKPKETPKPIKRKSDFSAIKIKHYFSRRNAN